MQLPAIQYGDWKTVKKRMARVVTQLKRSADLIELMTADGMLDTEKHPGMLVMHGIKQGSDSSFHCFAPWKLAFDSFAAAENPDAFTTVEDAILREHFCPPIALWRMCSNESSNGLSQNVHRPGTIGHSSMSL